MLFFITWGQHKTNHRAPRTPRKSETKEAKIEKKGKKTTHCVSGVTELAHITGGFIVHSAAGFQKGREEKSMAYLPRLGSSFPLVSAANWRQVLICCHRNWCINPRAPSFWGQGQYGWTSLSWNKWVMRNGRGVTSHISPLHTGQMMSVNWLLLCAL